MRTYSAKEQELTRKWYLLDAAHKPMGRVAVEAAKILRGKNKPIFTTHVDTGDHVIIINAEKAVLSGTKSKELIYWHSLYPGGIKSISRGKEMALNPERSMMRAVKGMLPHNKLGARMLKKLRVYRGPEHDQKAQKPEPVTT